MTWTPERRSEVRALISRLAQTDQSNTFDTRAAMYLLRDALDALEAQQAELDAARSLLADIRPMAAWESCEYTTRFNAYRRERGLPEADTTNVDSSTHCCDWNEVVERIDAARAAQGAES